MDQALKKAETMWTMLDHLAASDPQGYRNFVTGTMKEAKECMSPPQPHMCIQDTIACTGETCYINVLSWTKVPPPKSYEDPVPLHGGMQMRHHSKKLFIVVASPKVLEQFGKKAANVHDQDTLVQLMLDFIESVNQGIQFRRKYIILKNQDIVGELKDVWHILQGKPKGSHREKKSGLLTSNPASLLNELSNITGDIIDAEALQCINDSINNQSSTSSKLIEEVQEGKENIHLYGSKGAVSKKSVIKSQKTFLQGTSDAEFTTGDSDSDKQCPELPQWELHRILSEEGNMWKLRIHLPKVDNVEQCNLLVSQDDIELEVGDLYRLNLELPVPVQCDTARARFSERRHILTVILRDHDMLQMQVEN